jgi:transcriptional regulator with XRE-family HTH domain
MLSRMSGAGAQALASIRSRVGLSQRALARLANVPPSTVSRIERGEVDPSIGMLIRLAEAAGQSVVITTTPRAVPTLADAVAASGLEPDWTRFKAIIDWLALHPGDADAAIADQPDLRRATPRTANLAAAVAERIAHLHGRAVPRWTRTVPPLDEPWEHPGTPRMIQRSRAAAPSQFRDRNIWLAADAAWSR